MTPDVSLHEDGRDEVKKEALQVAFGKGVQKIAMGATVGYPGGRNATV